MKILQMIGSGLAAMILMTGIAMADAGPHMGMGKDMGMMSDDADGYRMMYKEHHQMTQDMMMMLKDVMEKAAGPGAAREGKNREAVRCTLRFEFFGGIRSVRLQPVQGIISIRQVHIGSPGGYQGRIT